MRFRRIALRLLLGAVFVYAAIVLVMYSLQTELLFPRDAVGPAGPSPPGTEQLQLRTADGETLRGVHIPPQGNAAGERVLVLGFAGNAWNSENAAALLHDLYSAADVVAFHYRGYAPSTGSPSARALMDDAPVIHDFAIARLRPVRTIAVGFSIGSGVAADLAGKRPLDGVILVTPFDSLTSVAKAWYPWLPVRTLFKHELDAAGAIGRSQAPVAVISAERDEVVPTVRTDALKRRIPKLVFDRAIAGAGHNDLYGRAEFDEAMADAMDALGK